MKKYSLLGLGAGILAVLSMIATPVLAQETLDRVKARGHLRCQVGTPSPGFYQLSADGTWSGSDVSVCRAVATAIFGDPNKVEFQSVTSAVRFTALANGESDMLSRTATAPIATLVNRRGKCCNGRGRVAGTLRMTFEVVSAAEPGC